MPTTTIADARHEVRVDLEGKQTSWPYVAMTMQLMDLFGVTPELLRDPGTGPGAVHQRRQYLREQGEQPLVIDATGCQGIVERAVPATELRFQGQLHQRPHRAIGAQDGVRQLEQRVRPRRQAPQQLLPELPQRAERRVPRKDQQPGTRA